jgi:hypothetical protein
VCFVCDRELRKELLTKTRANTPWPMPRPALPRMPGVQPCHHLWGNRGRS